MVVTLLGSLSIELQDTVTPADDDFASDALAPVQLVAKRTGIGRFRSTQQMS